MDPMTIIDSMSSYQGGDWETATGLPQGTMIPIGIAVTIIGILATAFLPGIITGSMA